MHPVDKNAVLPTDLLIELSHGAQWMNSTLNRSEVIRGILDKGARLAGSEGSCLVLTDDAREEGQETHSCGIGDAFLHLFQKGGMVPLCGIWGAIGSTIPYATRQILPARRSSRQLIGRRSSSSSQ